MAVIINGKVYRNLQEQVLENTNDIENLKKPYGYKGPYDSLEDIPQEDKFDNAIYMIGTEEPYEIYKYNSTSDTFAYLGVYPLPGPQGQPGQNGTDGVTPHIGNNGHWFIGDTDTGISAQGPQGDPGVSPHIGANGNWFVGDVDTGVKAQGPKGDPGSAVPDWSNLREENITNQYTYSNGYEQYFSTANRLYAYYSKPYDAPATGGGTYQTDEKSLIQLLNNEITLSNRIGNGSEDYNMYAAFYIKDGVASYASQVIKDAEGLHPGRIEFTFPTSEDLMDYPNIAKSMFGRIATTADAGYVTYWKLGSNDSMPNYIYLSDNATRTNITDDYKTAFGSDRAAFIVEKTISGPTADVETKVYQKIGRFYDEVNNKTLHYFQCTQVTGANAQEIDVSLMIIDSTPIEDPEHPGSLYYYKYAVSYVNRTIPTSTYMNSLLAQKQATLVSGTNIKTVNGNSLLGSGDLQLTVSTAWNDIIGKPTFATVATSGSYNDLTNKPTIPTKTSDLTNDSNFISGITSQMIITALGYTPGTSNFSGSYNDLTNKPTIPTKTSDLQNDSGFITSVSWNDILSKPTFATVATSGDYNDLLNKPTIPTKVSDLTNDSGFITSSALSGYATQTWVGQQGYLTAITSAMIATALGYTPEHKLSADNSDTYIADLNGNGTGLTSFKNRLTGSDYGQGNAKLLTSDAIQFLINQAIASVSTISFQVVQTLPVSDIQTNVIYLVLKNPTEQDNLYNEWIYVNNNWELIGSTEVDLSNYYTKAEVNGMVPTTASSTSVVTPTTSAFVTGTTKTTETLTFTYSDNTTANITIVTSVTDNTSNAMTGATVATTTTLS